MPGIYIPPPSCFSVATAAAEKIAEDFGLKVIITWDDLRGSKFTYTVDRTNPTDKGRGA